MDDPYAELSQKFIDHYDTLRGVVRTALIDRQLREHLAPPPAKILDVGGGAGHQSIPLARSGYDVVILDPSQDMLARAGAALKKERLHVELVSGYGEAAPELFEAASFDAVLCHGVVMYLDDPSPLIASMSAVLKPAGLLSVLAKNAATLAIRPALQGRWADALELFDADRDVGNLGAVTRGDTVEDLTTTFDQAGLDVVTWYGVRVLTDHLGSLPPGDDVDTVLEVEWEASRRDPYRQFGRLFHLIGRKR